MGVTQAFLPFNMYMDFDAFIDDNIDHWYLDFVQFWGEHSQLKPCESIRGNIESPCSKCLIVDGHMKIRRRLCSNATVSLSLPTHFEHVFDDIVVGCSHSPGVDSPLCHVCKDAGVVNVFPKKRLTLKEKENSRRRMKRRDGDDVANNSMMDVSGALVENDRFSV